MSSVLASLGWDEQYAAEFAPYRFTHLPARIARIDRGAADVLTESGGRRIELSVEHADVAVGDWVGIVEDRLDVTLPRRTAILRAAASGESVAQTLVANVDLVLITVPAVPHPRLGMVERLIALAWDSGAVPVLVVTKVDVSPDPGRTAAEVSQAAPGCEVIVVSALTGEGMADVAQFDRRGQSLCLLGRSGAGKSTLANALLSEPQMAVSEVRRDGKGRHTTTHRELMALPGGGVLIDTPGLRGVGLWIADDGVAQTFPEIEALVDRCRFNDCAHDREPGCAVLAAVEEGTLPQRRLDSWRKLDREAEWIASRSDYRLRQQRAARWNRIRAEAGPTRVDPARRH